MSLKQRFLITRLLGLLALVAMALAAAFWAPRAHAAIVTTSQQLSADGGSGTTTLTFDNFDVALGSLLSAKLELSATADQNATLVVPCKPSAGSCFERESFSITETIQLFVHGSISLSDTGTDGTTINCSANGGSTGVCVDPLHTSVAASGLATDAVTLGLFDDPGTFSVSFLLESSSSKPAPAQHVSGTVTYTYDDSPLADVAEPGTLASAILAVLGLAGTRRMRGGHRSSQSA